MYLLEFVLRKTWQVAIPVSVWLLVLVAPIMLSQFGFLDFALIEGRCYRPLGKCGQDNVILMATGIGVLLAIPAIVTTVICVAWNNNEWIEERQELKRKREPAPPREPTRPDIYN